MQEWPALWIGTMQSRRYTSDGCELELILDEVRAASGDPRSRGGQMQPCGRTGVALEMRLGRDVTRPLTSEEDIHMSCIAQLLEWFGEGQHSNRKFGEGQRSNFPLERGRTSKRSQCIN